MFSLSCSVFDGPLDLLMGMVERGEVDAAHVPVATIVVQYLRYRAGNGVHVDETSAFVAMAARLMLLKSRALLPRPPAAPPIEEPPADLELILAEYRRFKEAAGALRERQEAGLRSFPRLAPPPVIPPGPGLSHVTLQRLAKIVQEVLARQRDELPVEVPRETVTIRQKIEELDALLDREGQVSFIAFISASRSRLEVVVGFMAVLELIRRGRALAEQPAAFGDILILPAAVVPVTA